MPATFTAVIWFIRMGEEQLVLDGRSYALMTRGNECDRR